MDRRLTYPGAIPVETDLLWAAREAMVGLGCLYNDLIGTQTLAARLPCTPSGMTVSIGAGSLYSQQQIDPTPYSSLAIDTNLIVKQGLLFTPVGFACPAPGSGTLYYLIEGAFSETDVNLVTLPYYNAENPSQAYSGPQNNGQAQATLRQSAILLQLKSGTAAPAVDAGYIALYTIAVPAGAGAITPAMVTQITANFLPQGPYIPIADGPFVTPAELTVDLIPYATVVQLNNAVAPLATTATLNADMTAQTNALNAAVAPLANNATVNSELALKANLASPALTGNPTAPTPVASDNDTSIATTAYVTGADATVLSTVNTDLALKANLASPALTGTPTAPTAAPGTNSTQIATCAFVEAAASGATSTTITQGGSFNCSDGVVNVAFSPAFPNACSGVTVTWYYASPTVGWIVPGSVSASGFQYQNGSAGECLYTAVGS